jgi:hypothetical protein
MMASKDNKYKYADRAEEEVEEAPLKKERMINNDNDDDDDGDSSSSIDDFSSEPEEEVSSEEEEMNLPAGSEEKFRSNEAAPTIGTPLTQRATAQSETAGKPLTTGTPPTMKKSISLMTGAPSIR